MLKELFESIVSFAHKAARPTVMHPEAEPSHRYFVAQPGGAWQPMEADPAPRQHRASDLSAIIEWAKQRQGRSDVCVWFSREAVVALLDDSTRRDFVRLSLVFHPQLRLLGELEKTKPWHDQRAFLSLLRIELDGCFAEGSRLLETFKRLRFKKVEEGALAIVHNKASIGRQLEAELTGVPAIPEEVTLQVPVFAGRQSQYRDCVRCAIEIDPASEELKIVPFPGEIENAICKAEVRIGDQLAVGIGSVGVPIYYGAP